VGGEPGLGIRVDPPDDFQHVVSPAFDVLVEKAIVVGNPISEMLNVAHRF
jgi:hypothetical protein